MNTSKVAVVICTYNMEKYLSECLESVLALRYPDLEIIVVDDGSTDDTKALINRDFSGKVNYVYQENAGLFNARNTGLRAAGDVDYYSIVDADDIVHPMKVWDEVAFMEQNPDVGICFSNVVAFRREMIGRQVVWDVNDLLGEELNYGVIKHPIKKIVNFYSYTSVSTIRAATMQEIGCYDSSLKCCGDLDLAIRMTRKAKTGFVNRIRYLQRYDNQGMTTYMTDRIVTLLKVFDKVWATSSEYSADELQHLRGMEWWFLVRALWGTDIGTVDVELRKGIQRRMLQQPTISRLLKVGLLKCIIGLGIAKKISHWKQSRRQSPDSELKIDLNALLSDLSSVFPSSPPSR